MAHDTAATNGTHLYWSRDFIKTLSVLELVGVIAHEILHCVFKHFELPDGYDDKLWNIACDLVINSLLRQWGFILPDGALFEFQGIHGTDKNAHKCYAELLQKVGPSNQPGQLVLKQGAGGKDGETVSVPKESNDILKPNADDAGDPIETDKTLDELKIDWEMAVANATEEAKRAGVMPGGLEELVQALLKPQVNWVAATRRWLMPDNTKKNWSKFKKRWFSNNIYLPAKRNKRLKPGVIVVDSSGSMTTRQEEEAASETSALLREMRPDHVLFFSCDTRVHEPRILYRKDLPLTKLAIHGRGGTDFRHAFQFVEELDWTPSWMVYFTDLDVNERSFEFQPDYPVLWVCNDRTATAPWGKVVYI